MEKIIIIIIAVTALILFFGFIIILYALAYQRRKSRYAKEKQEMESQFQSTILQTQVEIQEQTLKNIAQEIHDNIGQVLILAKLNLNTFPPADEAVTNKINATKELVSKAINDLRDVSRSLHGEKISEVGLYESIENELRILQNTGVYKTQLSVNGTRYRMLPQKEMVLFRILQESINNAVKHAKANNISIQLDYEPAQFKMLVTDDGAGFEPALLNSSDTGIGLKNMANRATVIGGSLTIHSQPGNGTTIRVKIDNPDI